MLALFDMLAESKVTLPPKASPHIIARGVELVRSLVEEEKRKKEECLSEEKPPIISGVRWSKTSLPGSPRPTRSPSLRQPPPKPSKKRPPDLHAPILSFSARLLKYVNERFDGKGPVVYRRAGIDRRLYSKIVSDNESTVSKSTALQLALGLQLTLEETKEFIGAAGFLLAPTVPYDRAFIYCFENDIRNLLDVNEILSGAELPCLAIRY